MSQSTTTHPALPRRAAGGPPPRVVVIQRRMTHYRLPLFEAMRTMLAASGIQLDVVYGNGTPAESAKADGGELAWGHVVPCRYLLGGRLCWQNASAVVRGAELVVVTQENKLLFNYLLPVVAPRTLRAFWGHGRNFQSDAQGGWKESFKKVLLRQVDWWFPYTEVSARIVEDAGFPRARMSVLNNAIDTTALQRDLAQVQDADLPQWRSRFGLEGPGGGGPIGLLLASLHADKRVEMAVEAAHRIRERVPGFQLVIAGDGPQRGVVEQAVKDVQGAGAWIHWLGVRKGVEKAALLRLADVMINPGMVGLNIVDSLLSGTPMVTSECGIHSPEIAYLEHGVNGVMTDYSVEAYVRGVVELLGDPALLARLRAGCLQAAPGVSIEAMARRFCDGIVRCIEPRLQQRAGLQAR